MDVGPMPGRAPFSRQNRQLLCDALLQLPEMTTPQRRDYLLREIAQEFPGLRTVRRHDVAQMDLSELLTAAYDYPGALRALWETISNLYQGSLLLGDVQVLIDVVEPDDLLWQDERHELLILLADRDDHLIAAAFHYAARMTVGDAGLDPAKRDEVVLRMESFAGRYGHLPPVFEFIDYVGHRCTQAAKASLHTWMDQVGRRLGFPDRGAVDDICRATEARLAASNRFYLVAEIMLDSMSSDRFFLAAWRQRGDEPEEPLYLSDESVPWDDVISQVHRLMWHLAEGVEDTAEEQVLELILPRCLITHSVDQWHVDQVLPSALGTTSPLVLRSFDRLSDPGLHIEWARNWRWLKAHGRGAGIGAIREIDSHDLASVQALRGALLQQGPPAAVLMLEPLPVSEVLTVDAFTAGLRGGAPIMVWSRERHAAEGVAEVVRAASAQDVLGLPEQVFNFRLQALDDTNGAVGGAHVSLVFDDFDRIPEKFRSRSRLRSTEIRRHVS